METDAVCISWGSDWTFAAMAKIFRGKDGFFVSSEVPFTFELSQQGLKYDRSSAGKILIGFAKKPQLVSINGNVVKNFIYDNMRKAIELELPPGTGLIVTQ
jgi:hypothetical protein